MVVKLEGGSDEDVGGLGPPADLPPPPMPGKRKAPKPSPAKTPEKVPYPVSASQRRIRSAVPL